MAINFVAIAVCVVANFLLGFLWYTPLFGKAWAKEMGFSTDKQPEKKDFIKGILFNILGNFLLAWVYASNMGAWTFVPGMQEMSPTLIIANSAFFTWLGFYVPGYLSQLSWEGKSIKLIAINAGYHLLSLVFASIILTLMR